MRNLGWLSLQISELHAASLRSSATISPKPKCHRYPFLHFCPRTPPYLPRPVAAVAARPKDTITPHPIPARSPRPIAAVAPRPILAVTSRRGVPRIQGFIYNSVQCQITCSLRGPVLTIRDASKLGRVRRGRLGDCRVRGRRASGAGSPPNFDRHQTCAHLPPFRQK